MPRRIVDISMPLENDVVSDPPGFGPKIEYVTHQDSAKTRAVWILGQLARFGTAAASIVLQARSRAIMELPATAVDREVG
jgi:hypothetical protein